MPSLTNTYYLSDTISNCKAIVKVVPDEGGRVGALWRENESDSGIGLHCIIWVCIIRCVICMCMSIPYTMGNHAERRMTWKCESSTWQIQQAQRLLNLWPRRSHDWVADQMSVNMEGKAN